MNPYEEFVRRLADAIHEARRAPLGGVAGYPVPDRAADAPVALIFSPHPDDEVIIGAWALRLLRERAWRVVNVAVTHGSRKDRQAARWAELENCCRTIGFDLVTPAPNGFEGVHPKVRTAEPGRWQRMVGAIGEILAAHRPRAIFYPHEMDWNSTHIGTFHLVSDALAGMPRDFRTAAVETEYWAQMPRPNVLVESLPADVAALVAALTWHVGEVQRNPYHLTMPAWMIDNVRRGGEWVGGQGQAAPDFLFGTLYRVRGWAAGGFEDREVPSAFLSASGDPSAPL
jgi:LmbE family N-acetylglucosaminyl deacetylase